MSLSKPGIQKSGLPKEIIWRWADILWVYPCEFPKAFKFFKLDAICKHATYMHLISEFIYKVRFSCTLLRTNILIENKHWPCTWKTVLSQEHSREMAGPYSKMHLGTDPLNGRLSCWGLETVYEQLFPLWLPCTELQILQLKGVLQGCPAGSVGGTCGARSQGREFEPHDGHTAYFKKWLPHSLSEVWLLPSVASPYISDSASVL